jgi:hypothetical protein
MAQGEEVNTTDLSHDYSGMELTEITAVLRHMIKCQEVLLAVNQQYIESASQDDKFRTEPRFQLQGSYRNMNKLAEKIAAVMNDDELEALIDDHYLGESQTLTTGAEQNLLKLAELRGRMTDEQRGRWDEIKRSYARIQTMGGAEEDPAVKIAGQLGLMSERLGDIGARIAAAASSAGDNGGAARGDSTELAAALAPALERLGQTLATVTAPKETGLSPEAVNAIGAHLGQVSEGLGRIGEAIATAATGISSRSEGPELQPYLEKLHETVEAMSKKGGTRREIVQTLPGGVQDLLDELVHQVSDNMMPSIRGLARRIEGSEEAADRRFRDQLASALKQLDQLRDLAGALRKLDTRGLGNGPGRG